MQLPWGGAPLDKIGRSLQGRAYCLSANARLTISTRRPVYRLSTLNNLSKA